MNEDGLSPARGVVYGLLLSALLWLLLFTASAVAVSIFGYEPRTTCATSPYDVYAVRDGAQVVRCP